MSSEGGDRGEIRAGWHDAGEKRPLTSVSHRQQHIAETARKYAGQPLTTLSHHIDLLWLREAYARVRRDSAPGVDGQTVAEYGENLDVNLKSLLERGAMPAKQIVEKINAKMAGWVTYFRVGHSSRAFAEVRDYMEMKVRTLLTRRARRRKRSIGWQRWSNEYLYDVLGLYWDWKLHPLPGTGHVP